MRHHVVFLLVWCYLLGSGCCNEKEVLEELFVTSGGLGWERKGGWLSNETICDWEGVWCGGGKVQELSLGHNHMVGKIPDLWSGLHELRRLNMSGNVLAGDLTKSFGEMGHQLTLLDFSNNNFTGSIEMTDSSLCSTLRKEPLVLHLSSNSFSTAFTTGVPKCISTIEVADNNIEQLPDFSTGKGLISIDFGGNGLVGGGGWFSSLCVAENMQKMIFSDSPGLEGGIDLGCVEKFVNLKIFIITGTGMTGEVYNMTKTPLISVLRLGTSLFSGSIPDVFSTTPQLQYLELHGPFTGTLPNTIFTSASIPTIILENNNLSGTIPTPTTTITTLKLSNNILSGTIPPTLLATTQHIIQLDNNHLSGTVPGYELHHRTFDSNLVSVRFYNNRLSGYVAGYFCNFSRIPWMAQLEVQREFFSGLDLLDPVQSWVTQSLGGGVGRNISVARILPRLWERNVTGLYVTISGGLADVDPDVVKVKLDGVLYNVTSVTSAEYRLQIDTPEYMGKVEVALMYVDASIGVEHEIFSSDGLVISYDPHPEVEGVEPKYFRSQGCQSITVTGAAFTDTGSSLICKIESPGDTHHLEATYLTTTRVQCRIPFLNHTYTPDVPYSLTISADNGLSWSTPPGADGVIFFYEGCHLSPALPGVTCDDGCGFCECYGPQSGSCHHIPGQPSQCACEVGFSGYNCGACAEGYFGYECGKCKSCHAGSCDDGGGPQCRDATCAVGSGECSCNLFWKGDSCKTLAPVLVILIVVIASVGLVSAYCAYRRKASLRERREYEEIERANKKERESVRRKLRREARAVNDQ